MDNGYVNLLCELLVMNNKQGKNIIYHITWLVEKGNNNKVMKEELINDGIDNNINWLQ